MIEKSRRQFFKLLTAALALPFFKGCTRPAVTSMPTTVLISSLGGIHQDSNLTSGGGTNDTAVIQTALNGSYPGGLLLIQDGVSLVTGLNIGSNTELRCSNQNCGFYLANLSNRSLIRNVNRTPRWNLTSVANASGGNTVYTGTTTDGSTLSLSGQSFVITGFVTGANNGTFSFVSATETTLTLANAGGTAESHAAIAAMVAVDTNITINNGYYNGNKTNQTGYQASDNSTINIFAFYGVSNVVIENLYAFAPAFACVQLINVQTATVGNCSLICNTAISNLNTSSVDVRGPSSAITLSSLSCLAGDDSIAFNARNYSSTNVNLIGPFGTVSGNISNVTIQNISFSGPAWSGIDLISDNAQSVSGVTITNLSGQVQNFALYLNRDPINAPVPTTGNFGSISLNGSTVTQSGTPFGDGIPPGLYVVDGATTSLTVANITLPGFFSLPTSAASITTLTVNGVNRGSISGPHNFAMAGLAFQQTAQSTLSSVATLAAPFPGNVTLNSYLVIVALSYTATGAVAFSGTPITDTVLQTFTQVSSYSDANRTSGVFVAKNTGNNVADTVTVHYAAACDVIILIIGEYTQQDPITPIDAIPTPGLFYAASSNPAGPSVTTTKTNETVIGVGFTSGSTGISAGAGFTLRGGTATNAILEDRFVATPQTLAASWAQPSGSGVAWTLALFSTTSAPYVPPSGGDLGPGYDFKFRM